MNQEFANFDRRQAIKFLAIAGLAMPSASLFAQQVVGTAEGLTEENVGAALKNLNMQNELARQKIMAGALSWKSQSAVDRGFAPSLVAAMELHKKNPKKPNDAILNDLNAIDSHWKTIISSTSTDAPQFDYQAELDAVVDTGFLAQDIVLQYPSKFGIKAIPDSVGQAAKSYGGLIMKHMEQQAGETVRIGVRSEGMKDLANENSGFKFSSRASALAEVVEYMGQNPDFASAVDPFIQAKTGISFKDNAQKIFLDNPEFGSIHLMGEAVVNIVNQGQLLSDKIVELEKALKNGVAPTEILNLLKTQIAESEKTKEEFKSVVNGVNEKLAQGLTGLQKDVDVLINSEEERQKRIKEETAVRVKIEEIDQRYSQASGVVEVVSGLGQLYIGITGDKEAAANIQKLTTFANTAISVAKVTELYSAFPTQQNLLMLTQGYVGAAVVAVNLLNSFSGTPQTDPTMEALAGINKGVQEISKKLDVLAEDIARGFQGTITQIATLEKELKIEIKLVQQDMKKALAKLDDLKEATQEVKDLLLNMNSQMQREFRNLEHLIRYSASRDRDLRIEVELMQSLEWSRLRPDITEWDKGMKMIMASILNYSRSGDALTVQEVSLEGVYRRKTTELGNISDNLEYLATVASVLFKRDDLSKFAGDSPMNWELELQAYNFFRYMEMFPELAIQVATPKVAMEVLSGMDSRLATRLILCGSYNEETQQWVFNKDFLARILMEYGATFANGAEIFDDLFGRFFNEFQFRTPYEHPVKYYRDGPEATDFILPEGLILPHTQLGNSDVYLEGNKVHVPVGTTFLYASALDELIKNEIIKKGDPLIPANIEVAGLPETLPSLKWMGYFIDDAVRVYSRAKNAREFIVDTKFPPHIKFEIELNWVEEEFFPASERVMAAKSGTVDIYVPGPPYPEWHPKAGQNEPGQTKNFPVYENFFVKTGTLKAKPQIILTGSCVGFGDGLPAKFFDFRQTLDFVELGPEKRIYSTNQTVVNTVQYHTMHSRGDEPIHNYSEKLEAEWYSQLWAEKAQMTNEQNKNKNKIRLFEEVKSKWGAELIQNGDLWLNQGAANTKLPNGKSSAERIAESLEKIRNETESLNTTFASLFEAQVRMLHADIISARAFSPLDFKPAAKYGLLSIEKANQIASHVQRQAGAKVYLDAVLSAGGFKELYAPQLKRMVVLGDPIPARPPADNTQPVTPETKWMDFVDELGGPYFMEDNMVAAQEIINHIVTVPDEEFKRPSFPSQEMAFSLGKKWFLKLFDQA